MLDISNFPWAECVIVENRNLYVADSLSGVRKKRSLGQHRFELELTTIDMSTRQAMSVVAKLGAAAMDDLKFIHPRLSYSAGTVPSNGLILSRAAKVGDTTLYVKSTTSQQWQLKAGDFIQIGADTKVFQITDDTPLSTTEQTISLTFPLRYATNANMQVKAKDVYWLLRSDGKIEYEMVASENQDIPFTLIAVEKI